MSDSSVKHTYYENMKGLIDPAFFVVTGFFGLEKLRSVEFINGPMTHQAMALAGAVNGLTIHLANRMGQAGENDSPYYKAMLTIVGLTAGALLTPYVVSKVLKSHAVLITPEMSFRIAAFNLVAKVAIYVTFTKAEQYYNAWNFPAFQNFDEMTEHSVRMLYDHFKEKADLWKKESFKKQLGFNQALLKYGLDPLSITEIDLAASLTKGELKTFRELFEKGSLTPQQATLLYNFHVPPQGNRVYDAKHLPIIDPRTIKEIGRLSDEQIQWHHQWFIAHPALTIPECQIQAFVPRFYQLGLVPPYKEFVAELPLPTAKEALTKEQVSYLAHFYHAKRYKWDALELPQQIVLRQFFTKHGFEAHPLREPTVEQMNVLEKKDLKEFRKHFKTEETAWTSKSSTYQEAFNETLSRKGLEELEIPAQPWSTKQKVAVVCLVILGAAFIGGGIFMLRNRTVQVGPQTDQGESNNDICIGDECPTIPEESSCVEGSCPEVPDTGSTFVDLRNASLEESDNKTTPLSPELEEIDGKLPEHVETGGSDLETPDSGSTPVGLGDPQVQTLEESDQGTTLLDTELKEVDGKPLELVETGGSDLETPASGSTPVGLGDPQVQTLEESDQGTTLLDTKLEKTNEKPPEDVETGGSDLETPDSGSTPVGLGDPQVQKDVSLEESDQGSVLISPESEKMDHKPQTQTTHLSTDPNDYVDTGSHTVLKPEVDQISSLRDLFFGRVPDAQGGIDVVLKSSDETSLQGRVTGEPSSYSLPGEQITYPNQTLPETDVFNLSGGRPQSLKDLNKWSDSALQEEDAEPTIHSDQLNPVGVSTDSQTTGLPLSGITSEAQKENDGGVVGETESPDDRKLTEAEVGLGATGETPKGSDGVVVGETESPDDPKLTETEVRTAVTRSKLDKTSEEPTSTSYWKWGAGGVLLLALGLWQRMTGAKSKQLPSSTSHLTHIGKATVDVQSSPSKKKPTRPILRDRGRSSRNSLRSASRVLFAPEEGSKVDFTDAIRLVGSINPQSIPVLDETLANYVKIQGPEAKPLIDYKDKARYSGEEDAVISIIPDRFLGVQVKRGLLEKGSFLSLLDGFVGPSHTLHYLDIDAKRIEESDSESSGEAVSHLAGDECLSQISSYPPNNAVEVLRLSGFDRITVPQLNKIMQKFPRVMHFDLRGSKVERAVIEAFQADYILETDDFSNVGAQFERCWKGIRERRQEFESTSDIRNLEALFNPHADLEAHLRKHPLGPYRFFVDNVWFLHGLNIDDDYMNETVLPNLYKNFPNARALDLSGCQRLTSNTLSHMAKAKFRIESLILRDCPRIFTRYRSSGSSVATEPVCDITAVGNVVNCFKELVKFISYVDLRGSAVLDPFGVEEEELPRDKIVDEAKRIALVKSRAEKYWNRHVVDALESLYPTGRTERSSYWSKQGQKFWFLELLHLFTLAQQASTCRLTRVMFNQEGKDSDQVIG